MAGPRRPSEKSAPPGKSFGRAVAVLFVVYALATLFPFYLLFIRTFVSTRDATDLHLWIPPEEAISMDAEIGNLAVFYNLDLRRVKRDLGISLTVYIPPRTTLAEFARQHGIPVERVGAYFAPYARYNGWITLFSGGKFLRALGRTLLVTVTSLVGLIIFSIFTGYALAGQRRKDQVFVYNLYLFSMFIPPVLMILPQFLIIKAVGLYNSLFALILLNVKGGALSTMIFTAYISEIPKELEEAAQIDGASRLQYVLHVLLPLMKVPIVSLVVIMLPTLWNDFLTPYVFLESGNTLILPFIQSLTGEYTTNYQVVFTGVLVSILPLAFVYLVLRKQFVARMLEGAVKG